MKRISILALALFALTVSSQASVLIQIGTSGWKNQSDTITNGMNWGLVVSTNGSSMPANASTELAAALLNFSIPPAPGEGLPSTPVQIGTTQYYYISGQTPTRGGPPPTFLNGYMDQASFSYSGNLGATDAYGLLWFPTTTTTAGSKFGFQSFGQLPNDGATVSAPAHTPGAATFTIGVVPEPSRALLLLAGVVGLAVRRRRK